MGGARRSGMTQGTAPPGPMARRIGYAVGITTGRRAALLAALVCVLMLSVAVPLRNYVGQRASRQRSTSNNRCWPTRSPSWSVAAACWPTRSTSKHRPASGCATCCLGKHRTWCSFRPARYYQQQWRDRQRWRYRRCPSRPQSRGTASSGSRSIVGEPVDRADWEAVAAQLGRSPRRLRAVAHRCPCALPSVVQTQPRLDDGTPFPTLYYLTCRRLAGLVARMEAAGVMQEMTERLAADPVLGGLPERARVVPGRARRGATAGHPSQRRRHAGPGEMPACPRRARPGPRPWRQPLRRRNASRHRHLVATDSVRMR